MQKLIYTTFLLFITTIAFSQNESTTIERILDFVDCGYAKTFTYKLEATCNPNETILKRWLLKDLRLSNNDASLQTFYFEIREDGTYKLSKGTDWPAFSKKITIELDSIDGLDAIHQSNLMSLSKEDSLHNAVNRLPSLQLKRNNFRNALKVKKTAFKSATTEYEKAQAAYDEGDLEPEAWDKIEVEYLSLKEEVGFIKDKFKKTNKEISTKREIVARLKKETGLLNYKSYRAGSY